jgi:two-component system LytT family response regulator
MIQRVITCMVVDDEQVFIDQVVGILNNMPHVDLVRTEIDSLAAYKYLIKNKVDVLITDIEMPQLSGLELVGVMPHDIDVIFLTAHDQYTLTSSKFNPIDYILKPPTFPNLAYAIKKVLKKKYGFHELIPWDKPTKVKNIAHRSPYSKSITFLSTSDIQFIEAKGNYVLIFRNGVEPILSRHQISDLTDLLQYSGFILVHRSYLVNLSLVRTCLPNRTLSFLDSPRTVKIAKERYADFKLAWHEWLHRDL